jgi:hypothetical protein
LRDHIASEIRSAYPYAIGLRGKLIIPSSIIEQSRLHGPSCHPDRDLPGSRRLPPIISRWVQWYLSTPSYKERLLPFRFAMPCVPPVSLAPSVWRNGIIPPCCCKLTKQATGGIFCEPRQFVDGKPDADWQS